MKREQIERSTRRGIDRNRLAILHQLDDWLETPLLILGFVWLALLVVELTRGLSPALQTAATTIWILFIVDFLVKFAVAPGKLRYLRRNWLTAVALLVPALRVFRVFRALRLLRAARAARGLRLVRILTSINRGMRALGETMSQRGFGYVLLLTLLITFAGAAGMYAFERDSAGGGISSFTTALWWTAMIMTTMGSEYWPRSPEGRVLCLILALYAFAVFGYVTAVLATFFIGRDQQAQSEKRGEAELVALRAEVRRLADLLEPVAVESSPDPGNQSSVPGDSGKE